MMKFSNRINELDGLRGFLALWVLITHIMCWCGYAELRIPVQFNGFWYSFIFAEPAVQVFIILSGFVITSLLSKPQTYTEFLYGRFLRIYPIYIIGFILTVFTVHLVSYIIEAASWNDTIYFQWIKGNTEANESSIDYHILWHMLLLHGLIPKQILPNSAGFFLPPAWSISLEWQFYIVAPYVVKVVNSLKKFILLIIILLLGNIFKDDWSNTQLAFLPAQLHLFLIGIFSYKLYINFTSSLLKKILLFVLLTIIYIKTIQYIVSILIWTTVLVSIFEYKNIHLKNLSRIIRKVLLMRWLQYVGTISYPIYILHWPLIIVFLFTILKIYPTVDSNTIITLTILVCMPIIILIAALSHKYVEIPFMVLNKFIASRLANVQNNKTP